MISKELLSEVLGREITEITSRENGVCLYTTYSACLGEYNIHELAHKVKEWAFWNDYEVITRMRIPDIYRDEHKIDYGYEINHINNGVVEFSWWIDTEPEAIFKAGEWVLQKVKEQ